MSDFNKTRLYADIADRDDLIKQQQARIDELAATVELLRDAGDALRKTWDLTKTLGAETRRLVERWDSAVAATPRQNLNVVLREVAKEAFLKGAEWWAQCEIDGTWRHVDENEAATKYANSKYPSDKDGE